MFRPLHRHHKTRQEEKRKESLETVGDPLQVHLGGTYSHNGMMDYPKFQTSELRLGKFPDSMDFKGGKSISRLKYVRNQQILISQCTGSKKLR